MAGERLCGNCGSSGHNKRTCKNPPKAREVTPVPVAPAISYAPKNVERIKQVEAQEFEGGLPIVDMAPCLLRLNGYTQICSGSFRMTVPDDTTFDQISNYVAWRRYV
jgi:hypothetical protein